MANVRPLYLEDTTGIFKATANADILLAGGLDVAAAAALNIGTTTASSINLGKVGIDINVKGNLVVDGTEAVTGDTTFHEDVILGDAADDHITFNGQVVANIVFTAGTSHRIDIADNTTTTGDELVIAAGGGDADFGGGELTLNGGVGGNAVAAPGGVGGFATLEAGMGGDGDATYAAGAGGNVGIYGGAAGTALAGGGANGGAVVIDGGAATGAGVNGTIAIGNTTASAITWGRTGAGLTSTVYASIVDTPTSSVALNSVASTPGAAAIGAYTTGFTYSTGNDVQQVLSDLDGALSAAAGVTLNEAYIEGNTITTDVTNGDVAIGGTEAFTVDMDKASEINVTGASLTLKTTTTGTLYITGAGVLDIGAASMEIDVTGAFSIDGDTASNVTVTTGNLIVGTITSGDLILQTTTAGNVDLNAAGDFTADAGGAISLQGATASDFTVAGANLTLQTTSSGAIILNSVGALTLYGAGIASLYSTGTGDVDIYTTGSGNVDVDPATDHSFTVDTTGTGTISLASAAAANFTVSGSTADLTLGGRGATITLNQSGATALVGFSSATSIVGALNELMEGSAGTVFTALAGESLSAGELVCMDDSGGNPRAFKADANGGGQLQNAAGFAVAAATTGNPVEIRTAGEVSIPNAETDGGTGFTTASVGDRVFMSVTPGNLTTTAPTSTAGATVQKVGLVTAGGSGASKLVIQFGDGVVMPT